MLHNHNFDLWLTSLFQLSCILFSINRESYRDNKQRCLEMLTFSSIRTRVTKRSKKQNDDSGFGLGELVSGGTTFLTVSCLQKNGRKISEWAKTIFISYVVNKTVYRKENNEHATSGLSRNTFWSGLNGWICFVYTLRNRVVSDAVSRS